MYVEWKGDVGDFGIAAALGERDRGLAALGLFRRLGACAGIEERELRYTLRRLPHDFKGDVAAHRKAGEGKTRRRRGQNAPRDRCHAVVAGVVRDHNRAEAPQSWDLLGIKPSRTGQSGNKHAWQRFCHGKFPTKNSAPTRAPRTAPRTVQRTRQITGRSEKVKKSSWLTALRQGLSG